MTNSRETKPDQLLDDLKSIRDLLDKYQHQLEPPLLTESADDDIPVLSDVVDPTAGVQQTPDAPPALAAPATPEPTETVAASRPTPTPQRIDSELRKKAQLILQDVIDDFVPQIEAEVRRRLEAQLKDIL